jgi:hypothetical protein
MEVQTETPSNVIPFRRPTEIRLERSQSYRRMTERQALRDGPDPDDDGPAAA